MGVAVLSSAVTNRKSKRELLRCRRQAACFPVTLGDRVQYEQNWDKEGGNLLRGLRAAHSSKAWTVPYTCPSILGHLSLEPFHIRWGTGHQP